MGECFITRRGGGGGNSLSYDVVCQETEPAKKEGRIWVKSSVAMTHFEFTPVWNAAAVGTVAIQGAIGGPNPLTTNSTILVFNPKVAGVTNLMKMTPSSCQQVQGSAGNWVNVNAYVCHSDTWVQFSADWDGTLFDNGKMYEMVTGGYNLDVFTLTDGELYTGYMSNKEANICTVNKIDVSNFTTLSVTGFSNFENSGGRGSSKFGLHSGSTDSFVASISIDTKASTLKTYSVDISSITGSYYIDFYSKSLFMNGWAKVSKIWLT